MKYVFQSGFAPDIERMLQFKESLGHRGKAVGRISASSTVSAPDHTPESAG